MARSNGELVAHARVMTEAAGRRVASVAEARELLATPKPESTVSVARFRPVQNP
jgi:uncharacterized protein (DUF849 family)